MKTFAKLLSVLLTVAMLFSFAACTVTPENPDNGENNGEGGEEATVAIPSADMIESDFDVPFYE